MPAQSKAQQRFMGMVHAAQKGELENPSKEVEKAADSMTDKAAKDFASTKHKGLPGHVKKENKIDLEDEDLPSAALPVSAENTMKGYDASCGCFRTESVNERIKVGSVVVPYAMDKYGEFVVDKVFKNKDGETSYTGKFKKSGESREFILHSKDKIVKEDSGVNSNATMASIEDLPNNRTHKNFPLPTNRVLWNATGKVCEGRPVVERIKMYEKKGGGWREGVQGDEQVFNSLKELYYERKQMENIKENIRQVLRKKKLLTKI